MKALKVIFSLIALSIAFGAPLAKAQAPKKETEAQKLKAALTLTDEQYKKVDAIYKDSSKQKRAIPADTADKKAQETKINNETKAKVRDVLTAEQQAKFDEANKKPAPAKKGGDNKGKGGEGKGKGKDKKKDASAE